SHGSPDQRSFSLNALQRSASRGRFVEIEHYGDRNGLRSSTELPQQTLSTLWRHPWPQSECPLHVNSASRSQRSSSANNARAKRVDDVMRVGKTGNELVS